MTAIENKMEESGFLKCTCQKCGGHIEFPAAGTGMAINCPHCGAQMTLTAAKADPVRAYVSPTSKKPTALILVGSIFAILVLAAAIGFFVLHKKQKEETVVDVLTNPPPQIKVESPKEAALTPEVPKPDAKPKPKPAFAETKSDFGVSKVSLQKTQGSSLIYAVGTLQNTLDRQRFGVKIQLNLFDENDQNIGVASDYIAVVEPHKDWKFKALLTQTGAVKAEVADITEQQ